MAFHVACPITCRRICFCPLGFPRDLHCAQSKAEFLFQVSSIQDFLNDPSGIRDFKKSTVQVLVPKVVVAPAPAAATVPALGLSAAGDGGGCAGTDVGDDASAHTKRVALQKKAAAAMVAAEDYARRFESGDVAVPSKDVAVDEYGLSNTNVLCRMCFLGEAEGSERARKMLSCKTCGKKYHRSCLKSWSQHRDLFHWSSWNCPSCRTCEICRRTGDPNKFMFCKRCDGASHCYCQHPPHKNVSSGPYLCPKHTRCHSCASTVPGNGLSVRWFLGYTCCDACGRLFVKGNYCPVCLKVYRDSESTPMVCCDICQRWVHCSCDGISDEKYLQFQVDGNLQYKCATCRGECYQVKDPEDAVRELWRRRDKADESLIASLRAAAGLPTQEDIFSISPYSDDEDSGPVKPKSEHGRSIKLSLKGLVDKSPKKSKDYGKKSSNKKFATKRGSHAYLSSKTEPEQHDIQSIGHDSDENNNDDVAVQKNGGGNAYSSSAAGSLKHVDKSGPANQPGALKRKFVDEVMASEGERKPRIVRIKNHKPHDLESGDDTEKNANKFKSVKANKLVINLGARKINVTSSPRSDASSCQRDHELATPNGSEDTGQHGISDRDRHEGTVKSGDGELGSNSGPRTTLKFQRGRNVIKFGKPKTDTSNLNPKSDRGSDADVSETLVSENKRNIDGGGPPGAADSSRGEKVISGKPDTHTESNADSGDMQSTKDSKFSLKLKIKNMSLLNQYSRKSPAGGEKSSIRGQRSKRKRPSNLIEKSPLKEEEEEEEEEVEEEEITNSHQDSEMMEASWILKKLGKDAIGKRVEVHQPSDNSWHKGVVSDTVEGTCMICVTLDDERVKTLDLGKQAVRFVPQKQKRLKT